MMNSSLGDLNDTENYYEQYNISDLYENAEWNTTFNLVWTALMGISLTICCIGVVGNGYIIWLLGFQIKRNCFTTFILNLAVADFGFLASIFTFIILTFTYFPKRDIFYDICAFFSHMMYINANFLITAISIDRCVAVLFPIWHCCSRPKHLSSTVCRLLWVSSFLLSGIMSIIYIFVNYSLFGFLFLMTAKVCLPLTTLSTVVLFIKGFLKSSQKNQGQLLLMVLITLLCFLILTFPLSVFVVTVFFSTQAGLDLMYCWAGITICCCLIFSINPVIYILVGRRKGAQSKESMKIILQQVFKEGEAKEGDSRAQTHLEDLYVSF